MKISMNFISDYVDLSGIDIKELINRFTLSTAEVEDIIELGKDIQGVVTAKILEVSNHRGSKKLHLLKVDDGTKILDIVCGAPNVEPNMVVALARENSIVAGNKITACAVAGETSYGMCLSEKELGISDDHSGLMVLPSDTPLGIDIKEIYDIEDTIFEVDNKSLTNRPDLWGHYGIAREISVLTGRKLKPLELVSVSDFENLPPVDISVSSDCCFRYVGVKISNIAINKSPVNMRIRLYYCGMRAINLLADLTNYIMLELSQPMHAFDNEIVDDIAVKTFDNDFSFTTLDGIERNIKAGSTMICNKNGPIAIAGIMGGADSAISDSTSSVLLESANFNGVDIRKTGASISLRTESSSRFEKILDPEITLDATLRFIKILKDIDGGAKVISSITDLYLKKYDVLKLKITKKYIDKYTGIDIDNETILNTLTALGFTVEYADDKFSVVVPSFRATKDISLNADLIEEITRIYGYDNFKISTTSTPLFPVRHSEARELQYDVKLLLAQQFAMSEVHSYIWENVKQNRELNIETEDNVKIVNSISPDTSVLRKSMIPTLLNFALQNKGTSEFGIFEIGRVVNGFTEDGNANEQKSLGILLYSKSLSQEEVFYKLKNVVQSIVLQAKNINCDFSKANSDKSYIHPYNNLSISFDNKCFGALASVHPRVINVIDKKASIAVAEINFDDFADISKCNKSFTEISRFPGVDFDLSLIVDNSTEFCFIEEILNTYKNEFLQSFEFVLLYQLEDKKSITIRFYFGSVDKTLMLQDVEKYKEDILSILGNKGITIRTK